MGNLKCKQTEQSLLQFVSAGTFKDVLTACQFISKAKTKDWDNHYLGQAQLLLKVKSYQIHSLFLLKPALHVFILLCVTISLAVTKFLPNENGAY